jgi:hypothetical protein
MAPEQARETKPITAPTYGRFVVLYEMTRAACRSKARATTRFARSSRHAAAATTFAAGDAALWQIIERG